MKKLLLFTLASLLLACGGKSSSSDYPEITYYDCGGYKVTHNIPTGTIGDDLVTVTDPDGSIHELRPQRSLRVNSEPGTFTLITYAELAAEANHIYKEFNELMKDRCSYCNNFISYSTNGYARGRTMSEGYLFARFRDYSKTTKDVDMSHALFIDKNEYICTISQ